jgi:hypothetical protein
MTSIIKYANIRNFADDTILFIRCSKLIEGTTGINNDISSLESYLIKKMKLKLNTKKSICMLITSSATKRQKLIENEPEAVVKVEEEVLKYATEGK